MIQINPLKSYIDGGVRAALTTPPSASLVFDLPGKAIWVKGVKLKGTDHTYTFSHDNYITLTNTPDSNESEDIKIGVNTSALKSAIDTTYGVVSTTANGLAPKFTSGNKLAASAATTYYFLGWAGSTLKWYQAPFRNIRINSETTDCLGVNNTDPLIISSGNGISVTWDSTNKKIIITNTKPDVNHNTDTKVALSATTLNKNYAVILKGNDSDEGSITTVNFSTYLKFNPYTKQLTINGTAVSLTGHTHSDYVTALGTNGNYLTWTKNGSTSNITVPYAVSADYANGIANKGTLDSQEKIDNFITANRFEYATFQTTDNNLGFAGNDGMILSISWHTARYGAQMAFDDTVSATVKVRGKNSDHWGDWYTLLHSGNYNDYAPKLDGTGASGTWGISISGNAATATSAVTSNRTKFLETFRQGSTTDTYGSSYPIWAQWSADGINVRLKCTNYTVWTDKADYASSATKLTSSAGSATLPIYFSDGKPVACTASSVFSNLSNSGNNISVTVAGLNRILTVAYANNSDTVDGEHASNFSYTHQTSFDFSKSKSGRIVTFDQLDTDYGWINGFASTHNNYLTSVLFNTHRTSNWYVGYIEGNMSTGKTNGLLAVHKLAFVDLIPTSLKNPYSLTTFGVVYDGSAAKVVGPSNFISLVTEGTDTVTDGTMFITSYASNSGFADTNAVNVPYKRKAIHLWDYIKVKTDSFYAVIGHNHDGRYVRYYAVTTLDCNNLAAGLTAAGVSATNAAHTNHSAFLYISDVGTPFQIQIPDSSVPYIYKRYYSSGTWSGWFKLNAGYADSAGSASKLQTSRLLWGQKFDGTANVDGMFSGSKGMKINGVWIGLNTNSESRNQTIDCDGNDNLYLNYYRAKHVITNHAGGNLGVGIDNPAYKLHVVGDIYTTTGFKKNGSSDSYVLLGGGGHKLESSLRVAHANTSGLSWDVPILGQHWSRLFAGIPNVMHHSSIFSIRGSIGCVVFCLTFLVESSHAGSATIICLFSGSYTQPKMRALVKSDGTVLVDLFWSGNYCSLSSSTQQMTINVIANVLLGSISPITSLTNDDTIPSGYSNTCEFLCASKTSNFYNVSLHTLGVNNIATFNINNQWLTPSVLQIGRIDGSQNESKAVIGVTNGNLHIDAYHGKLLYLNFYNRGQIRLGYQTGSYYISEDGSYYSGTVALANNASIATKLLTTRTIWGQNFDGTTNIDNTLRIRLTTGNYCEGIRIQTADGAWSTIILGATADSGTNTNAWSIHRKADNNFAISRNSSDGINGLVMTSVGMGLGTTAPTHRLDVRGDTRITGSIRDLAIGGGIYWNPYVESTTDGSDAASITVVKSGVAGGTTLVLSLMNDSNDTILFQTNGSARLYHNSYPILTTLNTYVNNNKGYINGTEITLVNNSDTIDGEHAAAFTRIEGRHSIYTSGTAPYNYIHLFRIANSSGYSTIDCEIDFRTRYHSAKLEIRISTAQYPYNSGGSSISIVKKIISGRSCKFWILPTVQSSNYNYYDVYYESGAWNSGSYGIIFKGSNGSVVFEHKGTNLASLPDKVTEVTSQWVSWDAIAGKPTSLPANGGNADTLDNYHANGLLTALSNSNNGVSITVGGTTKSINNISVNYATTATSLGQGALKHMCSLHATGTYNAYKITTDWHKSSNKMPTINIRGYAYGSARIIDCDIVIYHYDNTACNYSLINKGSYPIRVWQAIENNVLVFYINPGEYYGMFNVFVYGGMDTDTFTSWTMTTVSTVSGTEISCSPLVTSITGNASSSTIASTVTVNNSDANSTYRMVWHSGNTLYGTNNIYCNPNSDQIYSAGFRHVSYNSASYLLRSDGGAAAFNWSGQSGQPTWLWGGNSQHTYYVYNPSNFNVNSAAVLRGNASNPNNSHPGHGAKVFYSWNTGQVGNDTTGYSNGITIGSNPNDTAYGFQIVQNMWDDRTYTRRYNGGWQSWKTLAWTSDIPTVTNYYWANIKVSASSSTSTSPTFSTCYTSNWFRSTGLTGWYSESYGGGINMTDSTWVRIYNNKKFYVNNNEYNAIHSAGGVYVAGMVHSYANYLKSTKNGKYVTIGPQNSSHAHYETDATVSHWFNKRVDVNGAIWRYNTNYGIDSDGYFYAKGIYANRDGSSTGGGVSLYTNTDPMVYGIAFRGTGTYGTHGYVTSAGDWATYLTMNDSTTRGWIFRRGNTNVASIAGSGNMAIGLHLEFSNGAHISTNRSTDYHYGYTFNLSSNTQSIGMYSGPAGEAGGVVISPDGCLIYNSSDCGYNLQVRDRDLGTDLTAAATLTFGIEQSGYYAWSRGGFKKNGSSDSYVLLGGGGHKAISNFSMSHSHPYLPIAGGTMTGVIASNVSSGSHISANKGNVIINSKAAAGFNMLARMKSTNGVFTHGMYNNAYKFYYTSDTTISAGTNTVTAYLMSLGEDGYVMSSHFVPLSNATYTLGLSGNRWTHGYFNSTLYIGATNSTATNAVANCSEFGAGCIELSHSTPYIDFHYNKGTGDYTSRIIATDASCLAITSNLYIGGLSNTGYRLRVAGQTCIDGVFSISNSSGSSIVTTIDRNGKIITNGSIYATHFYENSDIRYKKILRNLSINSNTIATLPLFDFEWIENNAIGTGTSALAVQQILPNLVSGTDKLTLDYGVLGTIAGITACKELVTLKSELLQLKEKVKLLEDKLRKYENI